MFHKQKAFTLVELIVVIVILSILSTIAFLSFNSQSSSARDSTRLADLSNIAKGLSVFNTTSGTYPKPDKSVSILSGSTTVGWQGEAGILVLPMVKLSSGGGKDPVKGSYYTYSVNSLLSRMQLLGFMESSNIVSLNLHFSKDLNAATSYTSVYPYSKGDSLGIIISQTGTSSITYTPIQETTATGIDVTNPIQTSGFVAFKRDSSVSSPLDSAIAQSYTATGATISYPASCKEQLKKNPSSSSGLYTIQPDSAHTIKAYCDMTTDGGGWTLVYSALAGSPGNMTYSDSVILRSHTLYSSGILVPIAKISSDIYIKDTSGKYVRTVTGATQPIQNIRNLKILNFGYSSSTDNQVDWQGTMKSNMYWAYYSNGCYTNIQDPLISYDTNGYYWACGNGSGLHLGQTIANWIATAGFSNFDLMLR